MGKYLLSRHLAYPVMLLTNSSISKYKNQFDNSGIQYINPNNKLLEKIQRKVLKAFDEIFKNKLSNIKKELFSIVLKRREHDIIGFIEKI